MKKRLISFLLALSMMLSLVPAGAFADYSTRKQVMLKRVSANSDYFYPENSDNGTKDAEGDGWSYDHSTNTLTFNAPGETVYVDCIDEGVYRYTISSNVVVNAGTTLYAVAVTLPLHTTNHGTIRCATFSRPSSYGGTAVSELDNYGLAASVYFSENGIVHNYGEIDLSGNTHSSSDMDSTADLTCKNIYNETDGIIRYAWIRHPVKKNDGTLYKCQLSFDKENGSTLLNNGSIQYSTIYGWEDYPGAITGTGTIDHSYFKRLNGTVENTITNSVIESTCNFTGGVSPDALHQIKSSTAFRLESRDAPTSAYTFFDAVTSISFIGSPKVYVYSDTRANNINRLNGEPLKISAASSIPGVASVDDIGQKNWSYTAVTFHPDGTQDVTLSGEVFDSNRCEPTLIDGIPTESGDGWNYVDAKDFYGKTAKTLLIDPGYDAYFEENAIIRVPVKTMGTYTNHSGLHGGIYTKGVSLQTDRTLENVLVFGEVLPNSDTPSSKKQWLSLPQNCTVNGALDESRGTYIYGTADAYSDRTITVTMPEGTTNKQWAAYPLLDYYTKGDQLSSLPSQSGSFTDRTISFKMGDHEKLALELVDLDDNTDTKLDFTADLFTVTVDDKPLSEEFTAGTPHEISVSFNDTTANVHITQFSYYTYNESAGTYENCKAVNIYDKSTWPTAAGRYKIAIAANDNSGKYNSIGELTDDSWILEIGKRDLTAADFTIEKPTYPHDRFDGNPKKVRPKYKGNVEIGDITVKYEKQNDAGEWEAIEGAPVETGTYRFTLDVAGSPNNNPATGLSDESWQFTIAEPLYHVYVEGGHAYYFDATRRQIDIINGETLVPAKVTVYLVADTGETADTDTEITLLTLDAEDEGTVDDFQWYIDPRTGSKLTEADINNLTSRTDASFVMPRGDVYITTTNPNPEPEIVDSGAGTAAAVVLGGAAVGGVAYLAGTQLYLESVLPKGAAIPVNRQQLAELLWTTAGKPQPQSSVLFTDISAEAIDSQKAARWCVEQGLMQADGTSFKPSRYTFRLQVIKAWNDLQAMQKAG